MTIFCLSLGAEIFSTHAQASTCRGDFKFYKIGSPSSVGATQIVGDCSDGPLESPCDDPCHQGNCHLGHCCHIGFLPVSQIKAPQSQNTYSGLYARHIPTQYLPVIFRPPIS
jgi:hypothetical protein